MRLTVVGEFDPSFPPHRATNEAVRHAAAACAIPVELTWLGTEEIDATSALEPLLGDATIIAPGSPYRSMRGALKAIRHARETGLPLLGTCGGFQHVVIEYARHVLGIADAQHAEYDPYASELFIRPLSCSLVGQTMGVTIEPDSVAAGIYGTNSSVEQYYCNFGLDPSRERVLHDGGLRVSGRDASGEARILELRDHPFFLATLFVPQLTSVPGTGHPLINGLLRASVRQASLNRRREAVS